MNQYNQEFSKLNRFLEEGKFRLSESSIITKLGVLRMGEFYFKENNWKKVEIVSESKDTQNPLILKLENILPNDYNSQTKIRSFSIQVFDDKELGLNYGGRITIPRRTYLNNFEQISTNLFDDFKNNSFQIYQQLGDLIYEQNPGSVLLDRISLAMTAKFPEQTPNINIRRI